MPGGDGAYSGTKVQQTCRKCNWIRHSWHELMSKCCQIIYSETSFKCCHLHILLTASSQCLLLLRAWDRTASPEALWTVAFPWQSLHAHLSCGVAWSRLGLNRVISCWGELSSQMQVVWEQIAQELKGLMVSGLSISCIHVGHSLISLCWFYRRYPHILRGLFS